MRQVIRIAVIAGTLIMGMGTAIVQLFPQQILGLFAAGEQMLEIGVHALRVTSISFLMSASCIILGDALTGMGIGYVSAVNSFIRQLLVLLPLAWLFMHFFGLPAIWYAFIVSECASLSFTIVMFVRIWRKKVKPMEEQTGN
jgi:Na+-driven multidrug efflux pump